MTILSIIIGKLVIFLINTLKLGNGGTWPGEIILSFKKDILKHFFSKVKSGIILITGTNGKTTTAKMVYQILSTDLKTKGKQLSIVHNDSGANLLNGIVSAFIKSTNFTGSRSFDYALLEVDEAVFKLLATELKTYEGFTVLVFLNLFRDQLDRYGEVDSISRQWQLSLKNFSRKTVLILNADDPQIAFLGKTSDKKKLYFGLNEREYNHKPLEHATDSIFCPRCGNKLRYKKVAFSHLGDWICDNCKLRKPIARNYPFKSILTGIYNQYNLQAAVLVAKNFAVSSKLSETALKKFEPAFGRQEEIVINNRTIKIFLSKNPTGFNVSLNSILSLRPKVMLLVLNDRIPDGKDISWIWDVDFENIPKGIKIAVSGDRMYDLALRVKYALDLEQNKLDLCMYENLKQAIYKTLNKTEKGEILYILPTYSAMLEIRKLLKGRKIL